MICMVNSFYVFQNNYPTPAVYKAKLFQFPTDDYEILDQKVPGEGPIPSQF